MICLFVEVWLNLLIEFVVDWMWMGGGWVFVSLVFQCFGGGVIDLRWMIFLDQVDYMDGLQIYGLLCYQYDCWNLIDYVIGLIDVFWYGDLFYR